MWELATEHRELVAQHEDLQVLGGIAAGQQYKQLDGNGTPRRRRVSMAPETTSEGRQRPHSIEPEFGATGQLAALEEFAHPSGSVAG
jgi:hypothetical protein